MAVVPLADHRDAARQGNQRMILANQRAIETNQAKLDKLLQNQKKLDRILANQKAILSKLR